MRGSRMVLAVFVSFAGSSALFGLTLRHLEYSATIRDAKSKVIGFATIVPSTDNRASEVTVQLKGDKAGTARPWQVRSGTCAKPGNIWGRPDAYKLLTADKAGVSRRKADIAIQLPDTGDYHISVQAPTRKSDRVFACSDFYLED